MLLGEKDPMLLPLDMKSTYPNRVVRKSKFLYFPFEVSHTHIKFGLRNGFGPEYLAKGELSEVDGTVGFNTSYIG